MSLADKSIVVLATLFVIYSYVWFWGPLGGPTLAANEVAILMGGQAKQHIALDEDRVIELEGALGVSKIQIQANQVRFIHSPCRGKQCIHFGWLSQAGEFAACVPNKISLHLLGQSAAAYDAINF